MKFRKKPVVIEALQWTGKNREQIAVFCPIALFHNGTEQLDCFIPTLEGTMTASIGDWIIRGVRGEFYPCKPDIFETTYEEVV